MGNYGMYGMTPYISKKGKKWYEKRASSIKTSDDDFFGFAYEKGIELDEMKESGKRYTGLLPADLYPESLERTAQTKDYFSIRDYEVLHQSLFNMLDIIPFDNYDIIQTLNINNTPLYDNNGVFIGYDSLQDFYKAVVNSDSINKHIFNNTIIAFCFSYNLPNNMTYNMGVFYNIIQSIMNCPDYRNRYIIARTDMNNNRILFIISNMVSDERTLNKYKAKYNNNSKYYGSDIFFSKHGGRHFKDLENHIIKNYSNMDKVEIKKVEVDKPIL